MAFELPGFTERELEQYQIVSPGKEEVQPSASKSERDATFDKEAFFDGIHEQLGTQEVAVEDLRNLPPEQYVNSLWRLIDSREPSVIMPHMDAILDVYERYVTDDMWKKYVETPSINDELKHPTEGDILFSTEELLTVLAETDDGSLTGQQLTRLLTFILNKDHAVPSIILAPAIVRLDEKNKAKDPGEYVHALDTLKEHIVQNAADSENPENNILAANLFDCLVNANALTTDKMQEILIYGLLRAKSPEQRKKVTRALCQFGPEMTATLLNTYCQDNPSFRPVADEVIQFATEEFEDVYAGQQIFTERFINNHAKLKEIDVDEKTRVAIERLQNHLGGNLQLLWYMDIRDTVTKNYEEMKQQLSALKGAESIAVEFQRNALKQADIFLQALVDIIDKGSVTVSVCGQLRTFTGVYEIEEQLYELLEDVSSVVDGSEDTPQINMKIVDKYLFDEQEKDSIAQPRTLILDTKHDSVFPTTLLVDGIVKAEGEIPDYLEDAPFAHSNIAKNTIPKYAGVFNILRGGKQHEFHEKNIPVEHVKPEIVIVRVQDKDEFIGNSPFNQLLLEWYENFDEHDRPQVIMHCDGFEPPLYVKHSYMGFFFSSDIDQLRNVYALSKDMLRLRNKEDAFKPESLAPKQESQYDASFDLREWEHKTADTYQSLKHLLERFDTRDRLLRNRYSNLLSTLPKEAPSRKTQAILDLGTGEGRIGGMLARLGYNVMGLDISSELLKRSRDRIREEGAGLRGEKEDATLSYQALQQLQKEGYVTRDIILDDKETEKHYLPVKGDFFHLFSNLNTALLEWHQRFPEVDPYQFFGESRWNEYAFHDSRDMFSDAGFDAVLFNWHTFCEIGDPANQQEILEQLLNVMIPGGELIIEIPDRMVEPYISRLRDYKASHPNEPFGTLRDQKPDEDGEFSPRYFPGKEELARLLTSVGFDIDLKNDAQTYFIEEEDPETGEKRMAVKEYFITARKPKM